MTLAKGQEELKTLLEKEKEKKKKKPAGVVIMGRRFQGQARRTLDFPQHLMKGEEKEKKRKFRQTLKKKRKRRPTLNNNILRLMISTNTLKSV